MIVNRIHVEMLALVLIKLILMNAFVKKDGKETIVK
jgi:hypothetical protein